MTDPDPTTNADLRVDIARLEGKIDVVLGKHETRLDAVESRHDDHEKRLRILEERKTVAPWQLWTVFVAGVPLILGVVTFLRTL